MKLTRSEKAISLIISHLLELQNDLNTEVCAVRLAEYTENNIFTVENILSHLVDETCTDWDDVKDD